MFTERKWFLWERKRGVERENPTFSLTPSTKSSLFIPAIFIHIFLNLYSFNTVTTPIGPWTVPKASIHEYTWWIKTYIFFLYSRGKLIRDRPTDHKPHLRNAVWILTFINRLYNRAIGSSAQQIAFRLIQGRSIL